jgi:hypothetical protein
MVTISPRWAEHAPSALQDHYRDFFFGTLRKRTPGPPPFSLMNSTPANSKVFRILSPVSLRPPSGPSLASSRFIVGMDIPAAAANCSFDQAKSACRLNLTYGFVLPCNFNYLKLSYQSILLKLAQ